MPRKTDGARDPSVIIGGIGRMFLGACANPLGVLGEGTGYRFYFTSFEIEQKIYENITNNTFFDFGFLRRARICQDYSLQSKAINLR